MDWYTTEEVLPGVWRIEEAGFVAFFLVEGSKRTAVIDTGCGVSDVRKLARKYVQGELVVVNTHVHPDHSNGNGYFDSITMGRAEWENHGSKWNHNTHKIAAGEWVPSQIFTWSGVADLLPREFDPGQYNDFVARGIPEPKQLWEDGDIIDLGDVQLEVLHTPAHTLGSICLLDRQRRIMFVGDTASQSATWWLHLKCRATPEVAFATYERLASFAGMVDYIFPCHGKAKLPGSFWTEVARNMEKIRQGEIQGKDINTATGPGVFYNFGGYGPVFAERV